MRGTAVRFFDAKGNPAATSRYAAYVEADGTYATRDLSPGTYKVQFVDSRYDD